MAFCETIYISIMKKMFFLKYLLFLPVFILVSCGMEEQEQENFLNVSVNRYTFMGNTDYTLAVGVDSYADWEVGCDSDWVNLESDSDSIRISVAVNNTGETRSAVVKVVSEELIREIVVDQLSESFNGHFEDMYYFGHNIAMSDNGKYICGVKIDLVNGKYVYTPVLVDTYTGEKTDLESIDGYDQVLGVSGDGNVIVLMGTDGSSTLVLKDGEPVEMILPEGYDKPRVQYVNDDGTIMIGYCINRNASGYKPFVSVKWTNGEAEILESPDCNIWGEEWVCDAMARGASIDGSVIYGSEWTDFGVLYWKDKELFYVSKDYADASNHTTFILEAERTNISPDGHYIGCSQAQLYTGSMPSKTPSVIDTHMNICVVFENADEGICTHVTNDGTAFFASPSVSSSYGFAADIETKEIVPLDEWVYSKYGITISADRYIKRVSMDGKVLFGILTIQTPLGPGFIPWYCYTGE